MRRQLKWVARLCCGIAIHVGALTTLHAQQPPAPGCSASAVDNDRPEIGAACAAILDDATSGDQARADALLVRAVWHYRARRIAEAISDVDGGLTLAPEHPKLLEMRAYLHFDQGEMEQAALLARHAANIDPNRSSVFALLAEIARVSRDPRGALPYFNRAIELQPDNAHGRYGRARVLMQLGRAREALTDTAWLIAQPAETNARAGEVWIDGHYVTLHLGGLIAHADALKAMDRLAEAEAHFVSIVAGTRTAFTLTQRSQFLHGLPVGAGMPSRLQEALADAAEAVRLDPNDARAQRQYASTLEYARRPAEALGAIELALENEQFNTGLPPLMWARARLLRALGRSGEAVEAARDALLLAHDVEPNYLQQRIARLAHLGYWQHPDAQGEEWLSALDDAVAACMADEQCW